MTDKLVNLIVQSQNLTKEMRSLCCARCTKPIEGDELFKVGRYTYGPCCILKVEGAKV